MFSIPKSIQATVTLLENLHVILEKTPREDIRSEVLPMLYNAFESATIQVQVSHFGRNETGESINSDDENERSKKQAELVGEIENETQFNNRMKRANLCKC